MSASKNKKGISPPYFRFFKADFLRVPLFVLSCLGAVLFPQHRLALIAIAVFVFVWWTASVYRVGGLRSYRLMIDVKFGLLRNWHHFIADTGETPKVKFLPREKKVVFNYLGKKSIRQKLESSASYFDTIIGNEHLVGSKSFSDKMVLDLKTSSDDVKLVFSSKDEFLCFVQQNNSKNLLPLDKMTSLKISDLKSLLIVGHSGSGKTSFARYLMRSFVALGFKVIYLDPKAPLNSDLEALGVDYRPYGRSIRTLNDLLLILRERGRLKKKDIQKQKDIFLFIDEFASIYRGDKDKKKIFDEKLKDLVNRCREYRVHVVLISQSGKASIIDSEIRLNCAIFVIGKPDTSLIRGLGLVDDLTFAPGDFMGSYIGLDDTSFNFHLPYLPFDNEN